MQPVTPPLYTFNAIKYLYIHFNEPGMHAPLPHSVVWGVWGIATAGVLRSCML